MPSGAVAYVRQREALGLGHAVWCARHLIGNEPFAVVLPDDVIASSTPCLKQMVDAYAETGGNLVAAMEVPVAQVSSYGIMDIADDRGQTVGVRGLVEKPDPETAPSNLAVIGRYILTPSIFQRLDQQSKGSGGEIQLTDALAAEIGHAGVYGFRFEGVRYDCGSKAGYLRATVAFALSRDDLREDIERFLTDTMCLRIAAE